MSVDWDEIRATSADLTTQDTAGITAIWLTPRASDIQPSISFDMVGGPKQFMRVYLDSPAPGGYAVEWSWALHESAVKLWEMEPAAPSARA